MKDQPTNDFRTVKATNGLVIDIERLWLVGTGETMRMTDEWEKPPGDDWVRLADPDSGHNGVVHAVYYYPRYERVYKVWRPLDSVS